MKSNTLKGIKKNALANYLNFGINSILLFFLNPLLVKYLGTATFGTWKAVQKYLDFTSIADGRSTQALKWIIASEASNTQVDEKQQAIGSAIVVWLFFLPFLLIISALIIYFLPFSIKNVEVSEYGMIRSVGIILVLNIILNPLLGIPDAVLVGLNKGFKSTRITTFWFIISNLMMALLAYQGYGIVTLSIVVVLTTILNGLSVLIICKKDTEWFDYQRPPKRQIKKFFNFSSFILLWSLVARLLSSSELLVISFVLGPVIITKYTFTSYVVQFGVTISMLAVSSITPSLGRIIGEKEFEKAITIVRGTRNLTFGFSIIFASLILVLNPSFVKLWMGSDYYLGNTVNGLIALSLLQLILVRNEALIQDLGLNIKGKVIIGVGSSFLSICCAVLLFKYFNSIEYIFIGIILGRLPLSISLPLMVNRMLSNKFTSTQLRSIVPSVAILIVAYFLGSTYYSENWYFFALHFLLASVLLSSVCYFVILTTASKSMIKTMLIGVLPSPAQH